MRIIPRLDIKGSNVVKGIHMEGLRVVGKPQDYTRYYYENGADELLYIDIVATLYGRNSLQSIIEEAAKEIFIPITVGGGLRSIEDMRQVLRVGADKIAVNTAFIRNPELIKQASEEFGSSTIVVSIEAIRKSNGIYECYTDNGRVQTGVDPFSWAKKTVDLGAGEILVTSIDREGTGLGYDLELTRRIAEAVSVPVIACGGAGNIGHVYDVINDGKADAVSLASVLHYYFLREYKCDPTLFSEGNIDFLCSGQRYSRIQDISLYELKNELIKQGIVCRER